MTVNNNEVEEKVKKILVKLVVDNIERMTLSQLIKLSGKSVDILLEDVTQ